MKWIKKTQTYWWAHYYSEDGNWKAYAKDVATPNGALKQVWFLENLKTGEEIPMQFKTLKAAKAYAAENN